jgi:hypothetical protein
MGAFRLLVAAALVPLACSEPITSPPAGLRVTTRATRVAPGDSIPFTVINATGDTVILARCCEFNVAVDRLAGRGWQEYRNGAGACLAWCSTTIALAPQSGAGGSTRIADAGTFRLRLGRLSGSTWIWDLGSNSFEVR